MLTLKITPIPSLPTTLLSKTPLLTRHISTALESTSSRSQRKEGDISAVFVSLSGVRPPPLPEQQLAIENELVKQKAPAIIPQINFEDLGKAPEEFMREMKWRGVGVIKGVVPESEARGYKEETEEETGFPANNPAVFELCWAPSQVKARARPNILKAQSWLMSKFWHSSNPDALISLSNPLTYADRIRIRQPGDSAFTLGPHVDGGSVECWEPNGYGLGDVYSKIFQGKWEEYDPWEASCRIPAVSDLYQGSGSCSMYRCFQGWLSLSHTGPREGTLMVNPLNKLSTAYFLLRPFFDPVAAGKGLKDGKGWRLKSVVEMDSVLQGANPGNGQELNDVDHPNLELADTMVHIPKIEPGDFVVWHCDSIHAVDKEHTGKGDSSVIYIGVNPTTEANAKYLLSQRENFLVETIEFVAEKGGEDGLRSMGLAKLEKMDSDQTKGAEEMIERANQILGFA
ncbi:related to DUF1479 domain protein [Phialocephala subalpina]|uniref:Related to DUF1479 domain protein n=1 Tax=Phialocephala subalpina TaxID=576137 RepID=A0A1L7WDE7_9HELO|nr:related to DUF1479 domain protein [Phialocephala subalpina]